MRYSDDDLRAAADAGIVTPAQLQDLLAFIARRGDDSALGGPRFDLVHLLWYAGALIVIGAMGLFSTLAFSQMGGMALTATAVIYAALFVAAGHYLWSVKRLRTPGGLLIAVAVTMAPLAVFGIQDAFELWSSYGKPGTTRGFYMWVKGGWLPMELAALAAAALAIYIYRFPFLVFIAAFAVWFMSMDIVPWLTGAEFGNWEISRKISVGFGLVVIAAALVVNIVQRSGDYAFWLYLFGAMMLWCSITASPQGTAFDKALYCAMNVGFLIIAIFLGRRVFAVFGTMGIAAYLGDLASKVFADSLLFPFALSLIGVAIIGLGLYYHRHQSAIDAWAESRLPQPLKRLRPAVLRS